MGRRPVIALAALLGGYTAACIATHPFDGYDVATFGAPRAIGGAVSGLDDGLTAEVKVESRSGVQTLTVANGEFEFPTRVPEGESYTVTSTPPADFTCIVDGGFGLVPAEGVHVTVRCASSDTTLSALAVSLGELDSSKGKGFFPDVSDYTVGPLALVGKNGQVLTDLLLTAKARRADATVRCLGAEAKGSFSAKRGFDPATLPVEVIAPNGDKRTYRVALELGSRVKDATPEEFSEFGTAVAISGDTIAVGARFRSNALESAGGVDVYDRSSGRPVLVTHLVAQDAQAEDHFGKSVALEGDRLVIGANSTGRPGSVYVFERKNGAWSQTAKLQATVSHVDTNFGQSVAVRGDTIVVGDSWEGSNAKGVGGNPNDSSAPNAGAAYVFRLVGNAWVQEAYLKASNTRSSSYFGASLSLTTTQLFVGAPKESGDANGIDDPFTPFSGAVYVFERNGSWAQTQYLKASNIDTFNEFGISVSASGTMVAVGSRGESSLSTGVGGAMNSGASLAGAVYLFERSGSTWAQTTFFKPHNTHAGAYFGASVALDGTYLLVGSPSDASIGVGINPTSVTLNKSVSPGAAFLFARANGVWTQRAYIKPRAPQVTSLFGSAVATEQGVFVVGQPYDGSAGADPSDSSLAKSGAFSVY